MLTMTVPLMLMLASTSETGMTAAQQHQAHKAWMYLQLFGKVTSPIWDQLYAHVSCLLRSIVPML